MTTDPIKAATSEKEVSPSQKNPSPSEEKAATPRRVSIKIGSQREESQTSAESKSDADLPAPPKTSAPGAVTAEKIESYFPSPILNQVTTPDLDDEIAAALGDQSLDDLIAAENAPSGELSLEADSQVRGTVVKVHREDVFFSLGGRNEGVASLKQFEQPPEPGTTMDVIVVQLNQVEGLYELTIPGAAVSVGDWSDISEGLVVEARITGHNKGGLECEVNKIRGFVPASQVSMYRVEDFEQFVDQTLPCVVTEVNPERRNLVLSHRAVLEREQEQTRQKLLDELEVGQTREGVVRRLQDFGAFVDIGGVDGLVHVSRLSWDRIGHPSEVLEEGQQIQVKVEKIDKTTGKIGLSYRDTLEQPWENIDTKFPIGSVVSGTVTRTTNFGAFVRVATGIEGLIHISELAHYRVQRVTSVVKQGQEVEVKVVSVDRESQRMGLSLKALVTVSEPTKETAESDELEQVIESTVPQHEGELKGGTNRSSGGDKFGLKW